MRGYRWRRRGPWLVAGVGVLVVVVLLIVTGIPLAGGDGLQGAADAGQLTGLLIAAAGAVAAMARWAWRATQATHAMVAPTPAELAQIKQRLAGLVNQQWMTEATRRSLDGPDPIPVRWELADQPGIMDHPVNIEDPANAGRWTISSDNIIGLGARFRATRRRRLVIAGPPGTGKTTLAIQLMLHLLETHTNDEPVPVLLPVADWDTMTFPDLHDWLADRLLQNYPALHSAEMGGPPIANALAARGHILAVLDGLDELSKPAGVAVVTALNRCLGNSDQLILTSRTAELTAAITGAGEVVTSAVVVQPHPVDPDTAADYLRRCLPPDPGPIWKQILKSLEHGPVGDPPVSNQNSLPSAVREIAVTAFGLWLMRTVYIAPGIDPSPLVDPARFRTAAALRSHLFDRLIPALIVSHPPSLDPAEPFRPRHAYDPTKIRRWLGYLAHDLTHPRNPDDTPRTRNLAWWRLTSHTLEEDPLPVLIAGLICGAVAGPTALFAAELAGIGGSGLGLVAGAGSMYWVWEHANAWSRDMPGFADLQWRARARPLVRSLVRSLKDWLSVGLTYGAAMGLSIGLVVALISGLARGLEGFSLGVVLGAGLGFAAGLAGGLIAWVETPAEAAPASTPSSSCRANRNLALLRGLAWGPLVGSALGLEFGFMAGPATGLAVALGATFIFGVAGSLGSGKHRAWVTYVIATCSLACQRRLPRDLMGFLEDAHRLGLLRMVGPMYQFRHAELQDHLASTYRPNL